MSQRRRGSLHERWAELRLCVIGPLLGSPPGRGELARALESLSQRTWLHPSTGQPVRFEVPTIERWYYRARNSNVDRMSALRKKTRKDAGTNPSVSGGLKEALRELHAQHPTWSYKLHFDNLEVVCEERCLGDCPSYTTIRRYMKANGLLRQSPRPNLSRPGAVRAHERLETREVRSYEATHVHGLWHSDFHDGSRTVLTKAGDRKTPQLFGALDDASRVATHVQWYLDEEAETFVHGLSQGFQKRQVLPAILMTDEGSAMRAGETKTGLKDLSIVHWMTLPYSPYQNAKQEFFWTHMEGRLMPMLEGVTELTLSMLNESTQAFVELEYNRSPHSEIGMSPLQRMVMGPAVGCPAPSTDTLRKAFRICEERTQRRSDGTVSIEGVRFELPSRLRHFERVTVRYARWDLSNADVVDPSTGSVVATVYPLDKHKNASGQRRMLASVGPSAPTGSKPVGMAPLLRKMVDTMRSTGLPSPYLPKHDTTAGSETEEETE